MLLKATAVWEEARTPGTPLVTMVIMAMLQRQGSSEDGDFANHTAVVVIFVVEDEELAAVPHLRPQTSRHCDWNVLLYDRLG